MKGFAKAASVAHQENIVLAAPSTTADPAQVVPPALVMAHCSEVTSAQTAAFANNARKIVTP
jgi:hypothetical protein